MCFRLSLHYVNPFLFYCCTVFSIIPCTQAACRDVRYILSQNLTDYFAPLKIPLSLSSLLIRFSPSPRLVPKSRLQWKLSMSVWWKSFISACCVFGASADRSLAPSGQVAVMPAFRQVLLLTFHVNLDFGKSSPAEALRRINNEDKETGILKEIELCGALKQVARVTSTLLGGKAKN